MGRTKLILSEQELNERIDKLSVELNKTETITEKNKIKRKIRYLKSHSIESEKRHQRYEKDKKKVALQHIQTYTEKINKWKEILNK